MNSFANSLFSLLFGWARTLIQQLWVSVSSGRYSGFFTWLGDHWIWVALALCLGATVMDFVIWLIRWRPYLVWRTSLRRLFRLFHRNKRENTWRFEQGYQGGVGLEMAPQQENAVPAQENWEEEALREAADAANAWGQPEETQPAFTHAVRQADPSAWQAGESPAADPAAPGIQAAARRRQFVPATDYEAPPMFVSSRGAGYTAEMPAARRRRRSEKYERRRPDWWDKLNKGDEEEDALLDGLPPAVDRQQAFHEPVYPRQSTGADPYAEWQRPAPGSNTTDGRA